MCVCPCLSHLSAAADSNVFIYVHTLLSVGSKQSSNGRQGEPSPWPQRMYGRAGHWEEGMHDTLCNKDVLHKGYRPKMLLYAPDELFYILDQLKWQRGMDEKLIIAYEILCLAML